MVRLLLGLLLSAAVATAAEPVVTAGNKALPMSGEAFQANGHDAFVIMPPDAKAPIPWVWYAPTLPKLPAKEELWMFERFLAKGIAIAGIDVGESYGNPAGRESYSALHAYLVDKRGFRAKPCLLARSRGGLMLYNWAVEHPQSVAGIAGIYPVCNPASYPGLQRASAAYGLTAEQFAADLARYNPLDRLKPLADAGVPILHLHGDSDTVVPLEPNSGELGKRYKALGGPVEIEVIPGQGHNLWQGWFHSQKLVDFIIAKATAPMSAAAATPGGPVTDNALAKLKFPGVTINLKERCVDVDCSICLHNGLLELIACTKGTKEHESIVAVAAKAMHIHTALLLLGAKQGSPAMRKVIDEENLRWIDIAPSGGAVDVSLVFKNKEDKLVEHPISEFISRADNGPGVAPGAGTGQDVRFPTHTFLFAGSQLAGDGPGPRKYLSDLSGDVISISTFGDELLCLPEVNGQDNDSLMWQINPDGLPPVGTAAILRLRPQLPPSAKSAPQRAIPPEAGRKP